MKWLLAKSSLDPDNPRSEERLQGHTAQVVAAGRVLLRHRGMASLRAAGLAETLVPRLERIVLRAAVIHDLGKCSDHFQAMVRHTREAPQLVRHEALSLWLTWRGQPLHAWISNGLDEQDAALVSMVAGGHHRKFWSRAVAGSDEGAGTRIELLLGHPSMAGFFTAAKSWAEIPPPDNLPGNIVIEQRRTQPLQHAFEEWMMDAEELVADATERRLLAVSKALLLAADVAGSALPKAHEKASWIEDALENRADQERLEKVASKRLDGNEPRPFQLQVAGSAAPVTFVRAGCGSGKTVAAYLWAARQHPGRQLWVTYPTTGTTTEGYRDYIVESGIDGWLEHSRRQVDLEIFDLREGDVDQRAVDRLEALRAWGREVVTCTVDTVLGLIQNQRKGMYAWPGLAHGAVIFDEIHSYDDALFGALLRFLEALPGIPVLLMTASLPVARLAALQSTVERVHGRPLESMDGPADLEELPRYRRAAVDDPKPLVASVLANDGKVLWVSNTVQRAMDAAIAADPAWEPLLYHSRYRYEDRVERHRDVIAAFKREGPAIAFTTQVAEMSLDLSADLLVTDLAPIPAMIQRLGRLNRRSTPKKPEPVKAFVVMPRGAQALPYEPAELDLAEQWLDALGNGDLSQQDLVREWKDDQSPPPRIPSEWIDGVFRTEARSLREAGVGITVVLEADAARVRSGGLHVEAAALPMNKPPKGARWMTWAKLGPIPIAPTGVITYDAKRGASWR